VFFNFEDAITYFGRRAMPTYTRPIEYPADAVR